MSNEKEKYNDKIEKSEFFSLEAKKEAYKLINDIETIYSKTNKNKLLKKKEQLKKDIDERLNNK